METKKLTAKRMNLKDSSIEILKTVLLMEHSYGMNYLVRILQGVQEYGFRENNHKDLETFGALQDEYQDMVRDLISYLIKEGYLEIMDKRFGNIGITQKGKDYLDQPVDLWVLPRTIRMSRADKKLFQALRTMRKELADEASKPPFHIFTDYTLQCLVEEKPTDLEALKSIPGIGAYKVEKYGHIVIGVVNDMMEQKAEEDQARLHKRAESPSHQAIKKLFEDGKSLEEIAETREIKVSTVRSALYCLHSTGHIDLIPWIEQNLDGEVLEKGLEYFKNNIHGRLTQAYEDLGLDYDTLRLCRMYVSHMSTVEEELQYAS